MHTRKPPPIFMSYRLRFVLGLHASITVMALLSDAAFQKWFDLSNEDAYQYPLFQAIKWVPISLFLFSCFPRLTPTESAAEQRAGLMATLFSMTSAYALVYHSTSIMTHNQWKQVIAPLPAAALTGVLNYFRVPEYVAEKFASVFQCGRTGSGADSPRIDPVAGFDAV